MNRKLPKMIHIIDNKPTILVCENCERVCSIDDPVCPICEGELTYFIKEGQDEKTRQDNQGVLRVQDSDNQWDTTEQFQGDNPEG